MSGKRFARSFLTALAFMALIPFHPAFAQQTEIKRYELYSGFTYFSTPDFNLTERGYHFQAGFNARRWIAFGFDYSLVSGHNSLTPALLTDSLQQEIGAALAAFELEGIIPTNYELSVPTGSTTQTFAAGPQLVFRHFIPVTIFLRPDVGAIREVARPHPGDPLATFIIQGLAPSGQKISWTAFYGFGGGFDWNATRRLGFRFQADEVYNHLFNDLLKDGRWTTRVSVGPVFHFGKNIGLTSQ